MSNLSQLKNDTQTILDSLSDLVDAYSDLEWSPSDGFLPIVCRAIIRRQYDSLESISYLVSSQRGYAAAPMLRPSCEEFIWSKYLLDIPSLDAQQLVTYIANDEIYRSLRAQSKAYGKSLSKEHGILPYLEEQKRNRKNLQHNLRDLGRRLKWPERSVNNSTTPSMWWLAKQTKEEETYELIYHATSRFVHFSTSELLRRAWGNRYGVSVRSVHFGDYWSQFSLHWGLILFIGSVVEILSADCLGSEVTLAVDDEQAISQAAARISKIGKPPIITAEELYWPKQL